MSGTCLRIEPPKKVGATAKSRRFQISAPARLGMLP